MAEGNGLAVSALGIEIEIPSKDKFGASPYRRAPELESLGGAVMRKFPERFIAAEAGVPILYVWKASGGTEYGNPLYGRCQRTPSLVKWATGAEFVIWFAADHLSEVGFMGDSLEALMFRCLCGIGKNENTGSVVYVGPEFHGYRDEVVNYGFWDEPLKRLGRAIRQPALPGMLDALGDDLPKHPRRDDRPYSEADKAAEATLKRKRGGKDPADTDDDPLPDPEALAAALS